MEIVNEIGKASPATWRKGISKIDLNNPLKYTKKLGKTDNVSGNLEALTTYAAKCVYLITFLFLLL